SLQPLAHDPQMPVVRSTSDIKGLPQARVFHSNQLVVISPLSSKIPCVERVRRSCVQRGADRMRSSHSTAALDNSTGSDNSSRNFSFVGGASSRQEVTNLIG